MTRLEWVNELLLEGPEEVVFRITRGCDRCGYYLPEGKDGAYRCMFHENEDVCRKDHEAWLDEEMDV